MVGRKGICYNNTHWSGAIPESGRDERIGNVSHDIVAIKIVLVRYPHFYEIGLVSRKP